MYTDCTDYNIIRRFIIKRNIYLSLMGFALKLKKIISFCDSWFWKNHLGNKFSLNILLTVSFIFNVTKFDQILNLQFAEIILH